MATGSTCWIRATAGCWSWPQASKQGARGARGARARRKGGRSGWYVVRICDHLHVSMEYVCAGLAMRFFAFEDMLRGPFCASPQLDSFGFYV